MYLKFSIWELFILKITIHFHLNKKLELNQPEACCAQSRFALAGNVWVVALQCCIKIQLKACCTPI